MQTLPEYELFAIRYATREGNRRENFIGGDPIDASMPLDYFVWAAVGPEHTFVIDVGFKAETAARRKRQFLRCPIDTLALIGVDASKVKDVILTHLHNDHTGNIHRFPAAQFHLQERELAYATGRYMRYPRLSRSFEVEDIVGLVRLNYEGRVRLHNGEAQLAPGVTLHPAEGHTIGFQFVRVHTRRGWVVVASDATHFYENMDSGRPFPAVFSVGGELEGFDKLLALAPTKNHIVPGHDPLVMSRYPAPNENLKGIVVRLDVEPKAD